MTHLTFLAHRCGVTQEITLLEFDGLESQKELAKRGNNLRISWPEHLHHNLKDGFCYCCGTIPSFFVLVLCKEETGSIDSHHVIPFHKKGFDLMQSTGTLWKILS